jgi:Arc/MetJ-type ribon-helix-helix transcriptional regulator
VARSLHVRLDDTAAAAVGIVRGDGLSDSEAVRTALRRLAAEEADREEMRIVREQMVALAPARSD